MTKPDTGDKNSMILRHPPLRLFIMMLSGTCLVAAMWGGLVRLGWYFPPLKAGLPGIHGPLIVCGFLGTFFSLERAFTMNNLAGYLAPLVTAFGSLALLMKPSSILGPYCVASGSFFFLVLCLALLRRKFTLYSFFIFLGSFQWLMGNLIWLARWPVYNVTLWWMSFVVLTTAGERLEIAQMMHVKIGSWIVLLMGLGAVFIGHILVAVGHMNAPENLDIYLDAIVDPRIKMGMKVAGVGMVMTSGWLLIYDSARSFLGRSGLSGYVAVCMISSYMWLAASGIFSFVFAGLVSGMVYDALIHAFFVGFLMFMIFGHGPILIPSILGLFLNMRKSFYMIPLFLHISLLLRIAGDMMRSFPLRKWGGMLNSIVIVYFLVTLFYALLADNRSEASQV